MSERPAYIVRAYQPGRPEVAVAFWERKAEAEADRDSKNARAASRGARTRYVVRETSAINAHIESGHNTEAAWCPLCRAANSG